MATLGSKGANLDIVIRQGASFGPYVCTLTNDDLSPVDLTGSTFRGQVRKTVNDPTSTGAEFSFTIINAAAGQFEFYLTDEQTTTLTADMQSEENLASQYVWDMELEDSAGRVTPIVEGKAKVYREVSKAA
jgi:uncharacterized protein YjbI with pentapeptide repeats